MQININNLGKKYHNHWIFRNLTLNIQSNVVMAIIGKNGAGKTTLMHILSTFIEPTEGNISYFLNEEKKTIDDIKNNIAYVSPFYNLIEDLTLNEYLDFYLSFRNFSISKNEYLKICNLTEHKNKLLKNLSSGMKQKVKLGLAFAGTENTLLLDEPTLNFDQNNIDWYLDYIKKIKNKKTLIIASNLKYEYTFAKHTLKL